MAIKQNLHIKHSLRLFELSMAYQYKNNDLPKETPVLLVAWTGRKFYEAKGLAEAIFSLFGLPLPEQPNRNNLPKLHDWNDQLRLLLGEYGSVSEVNAHLLQAMEIDQPVTIFWIHIDELIKNALPNRTYIPIPKYPSSYEDLAFVLPPETPVGPVITALKSAHPLVTDITLLDQYETTSTLHITYLSPEKNLSGEDIRPVREKLIVLAQQKFNATLKSL